VSELDKEKKLLSRKLAKIRGWIQAAATLLTNIHIPNLFKGKIYQGNAKTVCVPGLNCYPCRDRSLSNRGISGSCRIIKI